MKVKCIYNTGDFLRDYENRPIEKEQLGRFGETAYTQYGLIINKEYTVMGMLLGQGSLNFLIDEAGYISAYPYPLFKVIDNKLPSSWYFSSLKNTDHQYPYQEAIWGYYELVFEQEHYEKLVNMEETATRKYFIRKFEMEKELNEEADLRQEE